MQSGTVSMILLRQRMLPRVLEGRGDCNSILLFGRDSLQKMQQIARVTLGLGLGLRIK